MLLTFAIHVLVSLCRYLFYLYEWWRQTKVVVAPLSTAKVPKHLAIGTRSSRPISAAEITQFVGFCREFGIPELTIYNSGCTLGNLDFRETNVLIVSEQETVSVEDDGKMNRIDQVQISDQFILRLIPVGYETRLGLKSFSAYNSDPNMLIRNRWRLVNGLPDLVLVCDGGVSFNSICLFGFPSWLLKSAELGILPAVESATKHHLQYQLLRYSKTVQRLGH